jgi:hypothetical protein
MSSSHPLNVNRRIASIELPTHTISRSRSACQLSRVASLRRARSVRATVPTLNSGSATGSKERQERLGVNV